MTSSLMGTAVASFVLAIAITQVIGHYRRPHLRERLLRQINHRH
jgi:hypothetical protein